MFAVAIGALVARNTVELWPLFVVAGLLGYIGWAVETRPVRERFTVLHTPAMRFHRLYEDGRQLRMNIRNAQRTPQLFSQPEWEPQVQDWDTRFWALMQRDFLAREPSARRAQPNIGELANAPNNTTWAMYAIRLLDSRLNLLDSLLPDVPGS